MKDYRATYDISDADWKAIDKALTLLEDKFTALRDITDEDRAWQIPFSTRAEAFCRKAVDLMVKDRDVLMGQLMYCAASILAVRTCRRPFTTSC